MLEIRDIVFVYQLKTPELVRWHSRSHMHKPGEYEFHYFIGGSGNFRKGQDRYVVTPGTLHFSPPLERHSIHPGNLHQPVSYYAVLFTISHDPDLQTVIARDAFVQSFPRNVGSRYRVLFEDLKNRYNHAHMGRRRSASHRLLSLLWDLAADDGSATAEGIDHRDYNVHLSRAMALFEQNIRTRITVADVASACEITQSHLTRLFTEHMGVSPLQYYRRLRMDVAASLLLNSNDSIKEISWKLGYQNPFHFSRSFSRYADMSPREYRKQYFRTNPTQYETRIVGGVSPAHDHADPERF